MRAVILRGNQWAPIMFPSTTVKDIHKVLTWVIPSKKYQTLEDKHPQAISTIPLTPTLTQEIE